jgi:probable H4MPT-linked C1 transfer pathway protein
MNIDTVGWDIGGAHLKAVALHADGQIIQVTQLPCPLWQGLNRLREALLDMSRTIPLAQVRRHAVTMTGELTDCFPDRRTGVRELIRAACDWIGPEALFFSGQAGLMGAHRIQTTDLDWIGSANWLSARLADRYRQHDHRPDPFDEWRSARPGVYRPRTLALR